MSLRVTSKDVRTWTSSIAMRTRARSVRAGPYGLQSLDVRELGDEKFDWGAREDRRLRADDPMGCGIGSSCAIAASEAEAGFPMTGGIILGSSFGRAS